MKNIWTAKAGPLAVLLGLIFLIYSSGGFIFPLLHIDFLEQKIKKARILTHQDCLGQCLHYLLHKEGVRLLAVCFSFTLSWIYPIYRTVSLERFCLISLSDVPPLPSYIDVSISGVT